MMLCLVTDRRRLAGPSASFDDARRALVAQTKWAAAHSVDMVVVRERDLEAARLEALVSELVTIAGGTTTRILVSDRTDVALASGAAGVHLRGDSAPALAVRRIVPDRFVIGRSVHSVAEARDAGPVDYLIAGTVFQTASKPGQDVCLGLDGLAEIVQAVAVPVLAIGGITAERIDEVAMAGASGVAAIGYFIDRFDSLDAPS